jgi:hypothetical protein
MLFSKENRSNQTSFPFTLYKVFRSKPKPASALGGFGAGERQMAFKWYRTRQEWTDKGYTVTDDSVSKTKNRDGEELFSWGQVIPSDFFRANPLDSPRDQD